MASGIQSTYEGTVPQKRIVSDRILFTDPNDVPMITALGLSNEDKFKFVNAPGKIYEWLQDAYSPLSDVAADTGITSSSTTTTVAMTDGSKFHVGDVLQIDSEYIWVASISTNTLTVVRNVSGTQATHASTATLYIRSQARLEGAANSVAHYTEPTSGYNYSFIMHKAIKISRTDQRITRYGIADLVNYEIDKKMDELKLLLTKKPYYGIRAAGSTTVARDTGGLDTFITTNVTTLSSTPALTLKNIEDQVQNCWNAGGSPSMLVCGGWAKRKISSFYEGSVRTERSEKMGGMECTRIQTSLGPVLDLMVDRWCPVDKLYILTPELLGFITIDEFFYEELGKTADTAADGQVVGEYGFVVADEKKHSIIKGFSTST